MIFQLVFDWCFQYVYIKKKKVNVEFEPQKNERNF